MARTGNRSLGRVRTHQYEQEIFSGCLKMDVNLTHDLMLKHKHTHILSYLWLDTECGGHGVVISTTISELVGWSKICP